MRAPHVFAHTAGVHYLHVPLMAEDALAMSRRLLTSPDD
jgi:hypothetical protein